MIFQVLEHSPSTADQLTRLGLFSTVKLAQRRLTTLARKKKVRLCGTALINDRGRPQHVYARVPTKHDNLRHEVSLTEFLMPLIEFVIKGCNVQIIRGYETDRKLRPDADVTIDGLRRFIEFDCGTMSYHDIIHKRFKKYREYEGFVIWVTLSDARMHGLRSRAESVRHNSFFTTLAASLKEPFGGVLIDFDGHIDSMPKPEEKFGE